MLNHGLIFVVLIAIGGLLTPGCGCRNKNVDNSRQQGGAGSVAGRWTATLNPHTIPLDVPLVLRSGSGGDVSGTIAGAAIESGRVAGTGAQRTLQFTTGAITTQGPTGEMTVEGPLNWVATLSGGTLDGHVTGPDGRQAQWSARRN